MVFRTRILVLLYNAPLIPTLLSLTKATSIHGSCDGSPESVDMTIKELEENLKECMATASDSSRRRLQYAKVVGIACNVCEPDDVQKLAKFALHELGSINIWVSKLPFSIDACC